MFEVQKKPLVWITLKDEIRLAAKIWMPVRKDGRTEEKFAAILGEKNE